MGLLTKAIVLAAGRGERMKAMMPKQFLQVRGKPILSYTLDTLDAIDEIESIALIINANYEHMYRDLVGGSAFRKEIVICPGGSTRQESIYAGIEASDGADFIVIQNGVSPLTAEDHLRRLIAKAHETGEGAATYVDFVDAIGRIEDGQMTEYLDRSSLVRLQTPLIFPYRALKDCHRRAREEGLHDSKSDTELLLRYGHRVHLVHGNIENFKITTNVDLLLAEALLEQKHNRTKI